MRRPESTLPISPTHSSGDAHNSVSITTGMILLTVFSRAAYVNSSLQGFIASQLSTLDTYPLDKNMTTHKQLSMPFLIDDIKFSSEAESVS
mmetsp:Transcript_24806/g.36585  ORF Transcript_24806/g.36585 Transcript_24806/m.36585 type:complete len:91 (-) Transcript_24806:312-584(-)